MFISIFGFTAVIAIFGAMWAWMRGEIEKRIEKHVNSLEKKEKAIEATIKANHEIERTQKNWENYRILKMILIRS